MSHLTRQGEILTALAAAADIQDSSNEAVRLQDFHENMSQQTSMSHLARQDEIVTALAAVVDVQDYETRRVSQRPTAADWSVSRLMKLQMTRHP